MMLTDLDRLIGDFREAQDEAVTVILNELKLPLPVSNRHWVVYCVEQGLYEMESLNGVGICAHGFGIEITKGELAVDFDWGDHGEADGFDAWRLWKFSDQNDPENICTHELVIGWLEDAHKSGELIESGSLYYDPTRRTTYTK